MVLNGCVSQSFSHIIYYFLIYLLFYYLLRVYLLWHGNCFRPVSGDGLLSQSFSHVFITASALYCVSDHCIVTYISTGHKMCALYIIA